MNTNNIYFDETLSSYPRFQRGDLGKFEGEPSWVRYFWDRSCEGDGELWGGHDNATYFHILNEEREYFALSELVEFVVVLETSDGFVYGWTFDSEPEMNGAMKVYLGG